MTRPTRILVVLAVSLATAATGVCSSLSAGTQTTCTAAQAPDGDPPCDQEAGSGACPRAPARPTCRTCDNTVAFLLKDKAAGGDAPSANPAHVPTVAPRPAAASARASTSLLHLAAISSSPPLHLLNATFRN